jgi:hypothetical protein
MEDHNLTCTCTFEMETMLCIIFMSRGLNVVIISIFIFLNVHHPNDEL